MRILLILTLTLCLLFSLSAAACADIFRITPEISNAKFETSKSGTNLSETETVYNLSSELNFVVVRTGLDLGYGEISDYKYSLSGARIGTELPLVLFKLIAYGGYQKYELKNAVSHKFHGTVIGVGAEHELNSFFSINGVAVIPVDMNYEGLGKDEDIDFNAVRINLIFTTAPLVDLYVGYQKTEAESDFLKLDVSGFTAGLRIGF